MYIDSFAARPFVNSKFRNSCTVHDEHVESVKSYSGAPRLRKCRRPNPLLALLDDTIRHVGDADVFAPSMDALTRSFEFGKSGYSNGKGRALVS